jgi:hypothetical protein
MLQHTAARSQELGNFMRWLSRTPIGHDELLKQCESQGITPVHTEHLLQLAILDDRIRQHRRRLPNKTMGIAYSLTPDDRIRHRPEIKSSAGT